MQTIGERLEEARKKKGISIREAAEATKIRGDYLQKFESNHFDIGLTEIYTRGFLRTYATFLKLPADRILNDYSALGRTESRHRPSAREIYGRLDVSTSPAAEEPEATGPAGEAAAPASAPARPPTPRTRTGSSLPTGPDPAVVFKYTKWVLGLAGVLVLGLLVKVLFFPGRTEDPSKRPAAAAAVSRTPTLGLIATSPVQVNIRRKNADDSEGELVYTGMMSAGETRTVPRAGALYIEASAAENLQIEINGRRHNLGQLLGPGYQRGQLPAP